MVPQPKLAIWVEPEPPAGKRADKIQPCVELDNEVAGKVLVDRGSADPLELACRRARIETLIDQKSHPDRRSAGGTWCGRDAERIVVEREINEGVAAGLSEDPRRSALPRIEAILEKNRCSLRVPNVDQNAGSKAKEQES